LGRYDQGQTLVIDPVVTYATYFGGSEVAQRDEGALAVATDTSGNTYLTGYNEYSNFPTMNPLQPSSGGGRDAFITKLNAAGTALVFSTYLGGQQEESGIAIEVD
jgi:hypothetical protein